MTLQDLKQNIEIEKELIGEAFIFVSQLNNLERFYPHEKREYERRELSKAINSALERLRIISKSMPKILDTAYSIKEGRREEKERELVKVSHPLALKKEAEIKRRGEAEVIIEKKEKESFLKELEVSRETLKRLKKTELKEEKAAKEKKVEFLEFKKPSWYAKTSNRFFLNTSNSFLEKGRLDNLNSNLRKANMSFLVTTYMSMAILSSAIALIFGIIIFLVLLILAPVNLISILRNALVIPALPILTFLTFYFYPYAEKRGIESGIDNELPFVAIHMSAIAGSGIEPTQIFKIIALGGEYPNTKKELKKIINQVNVYGYDLVTALKNTARETSSKKLNELFNGMAATISGGGSLGEFLDKRAETLLFEYRLGRERKTKSAETFMDIYISIVIAAPMILTLLLILISISGIGIGLSLSSLTVIIISVVALINIVFLVVLHLRQESY
ncbi:MAG: type II secretion system F family protein [Nanoarchaeota archaeon]